MEGERERVHWSELGHRGRMETKDEKQRETGKERGMRKEGSLFLQSSHHATVCLPAGRFGGSVEVFVHLNAGCWASELRGACRSVCLLACSARLCVWK